VLRGLALTAASAAAQAQEAPVPPSPPLGQAELHRQFVINDGPGPRQFSFSDTAPERVIKGAPYCADAVHQTLQWLPDASGAASNRIVNRQGTRLCRDGEGRTRQEVDRGDRKLVYLRDPVAGEDWVLDLDRKTARRLADLPLLGANEQPGGPGWRAYTERMRDWARDFAERTRDLTERARPARPAASAALPAPPAPPAPPAQPAPPDLPAPVVLMRAEGAGPGGNVGFVRLQRGDGLAAGDLPPPPLAVQWRAQMLAPRGTGSTSPLGSKDFDGVPAHGERTTWVIEAGKIGNERPIQITREVWTAPELMVTVQSRDFDPRSGEVSYRLTNLKRGEPDPALMRVPAEFRKSGRAGEQTP
jgi:hypothetical protein